MDVATKTLYTQIEISVNNTEDEMAKVMQIKNKGFYLIPAELLVEFFVFDPSTVYLSKKKVQN